MRFGNRRPDEPEINLIPFIDVLLVVLIFLVLTTTYSRFTELQVNLPAANSEKLRERPGEIIVSVSWLRECEIRKATPERVRPEGRRIGVDFLRRCDPRQVRRVFSTRRKISAPRSWSTPVVGRKGSGSGGGVKGRP